MKWKWKIIFEMKEKMRVWTTKRQKMWTTVGRKTKEIGRRHSCVQSKRREKKCPKSILLFFLSCRAFVADSIRNRVRIFSSVFFLFVHFFSLFFCFYIAFAICAYGFTSSQLENEYMNQSNTQTSDLHIFSVLFFVFFCMIQLQLNVVCFDSTHLYF